jgi:serine/threonine protein kinase
MTDSHEPAGFIAPEPADLAPLFPGYEIQGLIATGGMGAVYCAVQKSLDRTVALKILPMEFSKDAAFCKGFETEAKAMARLNHPNLIGVYDFGEVNGMLYIVMEFVPGKSIYHSAHGQAIDPPEVIRLIAAICGGLAHAHENGIIHRDIKPANILLDLNAQPKIGDFGLARPVERKVEEGEEIFGTPHYTAPEVVDSPHSVDCRADIFSVGVMLHELLTGKLPADDPRPASLIARCDVRFDAIIKRATQPLPATRYSSAQEMAKDLQAIAKSLVSKSLVSKSLVSKPRLAAGPPRPTVRRPGRAAVRKKSSSFPGILMLLLAIGIGGYSLNHFRKSQSPQVVIIKEPSAGLPSQTDSAPDPTPVPGPDTNPEPPPLPDPAVPEAAPDTTTVSEPPRFDVPGFFQRARKIMLDRAAPAIAKYHSGLKDNLWRFDKAMLACVGKPLSNRAEGAARIKQVVDALKAEGGRIPESLELSITDTTGIEACHIEALEKQKNIDFELSKSLSQLSSTYILGLEKQIERLKADNDTGAIKLIESDIERTKESPEYFYGLMMGSPPAAE